jgi:hypothetical protein
VVEDERPRLGGDVEAEADGGRRELHGGRGGELGDREVAQRDVLEEYAAGRAARAGGLEEDVGRRENGDGPGPPRDGRRIGEESRRRRHLVIAQGCENLSELLETNLLVVGGGLRRLRFGVKGLGRHRVVRVGNRKRRRQGGRFAERWRSGDGRPGPLHLRLRLWRRRRRQGGQISGGVEGRRRRGSLGWVEQRGLRSRAPRRHGLFAGGILRGHRSEGVEDGHRLALLQLEVVLVHGRRGDDAGGGRHRQGAVAVEMSTGARGGEGVVRGGGEKRPKRKEQDKEEGHVEPSHFGIRGKAERRWMAMAAETEGTGAFYGQNGTGDHARVTGRDREASFKMRTMNVFLASMKNLRLAPLVGPWMLRSFCLLTKI